MAYILQRNIPVLFKRPLYLGESEWTPIQRKAFRFAKEAAAEQAICDALDTQDCPEDMPRTQAGFDAWEAKFQRQFKIIKVKAKSRRKA
jgi:hypothetical protein